VRGMVGIYDVGDPVGAGLGPPLTRQMDPGKGRGKPRPYQHRVSPRAFGGRGVVRVGHRDPVGAGLGPPLTRQTVPGRGRGKPRPYQHRISPRAFGGRDLLSIASSFR